MLRQTIDRIMALMPIASTDETRLFLNCVHIKKHDDKDFVIIEATNGHVLMQEILQDKELHEKLDATPNKSILLKNSKSNLESIKYMLKHEENRLMFDCEITETLTILPCRITLELIEREYAKTQHLVDSAVNSKKIITIGLDARYIKLLGDALNTGKNKRQPKKVILEIPVLELGPIVVKSDLPSLGVLMPIKI